MQLPVNASIPQSDFEYMFAADLKSCEGSHPPALIEQKMHSTHNTHSVPRNHNESRRFISDNLDYMFGAEFPVETKQKRDVFSREMHGAYSNNSI